MKLPVASSSDVCGTHSHANTHRWHFINMAIKLRTCKSYTLWKRRLAPWIPLPSSGSSVHMFSGINCVSVPFCVFALDNVSACSASFSTMCCEQLQCSSCRSFLKARSIPPTGGPSISRTPMTSPRLERGQNRAPITSP